MELTLFEFHLDEPSLSATAPFSGQSNPDESDGSEASSSGESESAGDSGSRTPSPVRFVLGLVLLVGLAYGARRLLGSDSEPFEEEVEPEPVTA